MLGELVQNNQSWACMHTNTHTYTYPHTHTPPHTLLIDSTDLFTYTYVYIVNNDKGREVIYLRWSGNYKEFERHGGGWK